MDHSTSTPLRHLPQDTLVGIELMHKLKKRQMVEAGEESLTAAELFYSLAA